MGCIETSGYEKLSTSSEISAYRVYNLTGTYQGQVKDGKPDGLGMFISGNAKIVGTWINGEIDGHIEWYGEKGCYRGQFSKGNRNGSGIFHGHAGKNTFHGEWKNGKLNGKAKYFREGILISEGNYIDDNLFYGTQYYEGGTYTGDIANERRNGFGVYKFSNGDCYTGQWIDGKRGGQGTYKFTNTLKLGDIECQGAGEISGTWHDDVLDKSTYSIVKK